MKKLVELQELNLPRLTQPEFIQVTQGSGTLESMVEAAEAINFYLESFVKPEKAGCCISCGTPISGFVGMMLGGWREGLHYGEGSCSQCDYPGRHVHTINDKDGELIAKISPLILQYHPDVLDKPTEEDSE